MAKQSCLLHGGGGNREADGEREGKKRKETTGQVYLSKVYPELYTAYNQTLPLNIPFSMNSSVE